MKKNKERQKEIQKKYHNNHKEERNKYGRLYWVKNKERIKIAVRKYYLSNTDKIKERINKYRATHKDQRKSHRFEKKYGITLAQRDEMILNQDNKCLSCGSDLRQMLSTHIHIDHDHITGKVRGILCRCCNITLGLFKENPGRLYALMMYAKKIKEENIIVIA